MENRLRELRRAKSLTQAQLATNAGVSRAIIVGLERGTHRCAKTSTLVKIADALGESVTRVFFCS